MNLQKTDNELKLVNDEPRRPLSFIGYLVC